MLSSKQNRKQTFIVQAQLQETSGGYEVLVEGDARVATTPAGRKQFEQDRSWWRFAAGGGILILDCKDQSVALVRYRDDGAPNYANHWTLGSGLSGSMEELEDMERLVVREACEEFIIATPEGIVIPVFGEERLDRVSYGAVSTSRESRARPELPALLATDTYIKCQARFDPLPGEKTLTVRLPDTPPATYAGIIHIDPGTQGVDLLRQIRINIPYPFDAVVVLDGEEDPDGRPIDSEIGCLPVNGTEIGRSFIACYKSGQRTESYQPFKQLTPVLRATLEAE